MAENRGGGNPREPNLVNEWCGDHWRFEQRDLADVSCGWLVRAATCDLRSAGGRFGGVPLVPVLCVVCSGGRSAGMVVHRTLRRGDAAMGVLAFGADLRCSKRQHERLHTQYGPGDQLTSRLGHLTADPIATAPQYPFGRRESQLARRYITTAIHLTPTGSGTGVASCTR